MYVRRFLYWMERIERTNSVPIGRLQQAVLRVAVFLVSAALRNVVDNLLYTGEQEKKFSSLLLR